jgi:hypothetical protein
MILPQVVGITGMSHLTCKPFSLELWILYNYPVIFLEIRMFLIP